MAAKQKVLITGAAGLIGGIVRQALAGKYDLRGLDRVPVPGLDSLVADITDPQAIAPAFQGVDVVVHLAADPSQNATWESSLRNNIKGTANVFEAARQAGVKRIIFASSNHVTGMYEGDHPYSAIVQGNYQGLQPGKYPMVHHQLPIRPDGFYGVSKAFGEALGRFYHDQYGISVACLRIGTVNRANRPQVPRHFATLCTHRDLAQLVERCIAAGDLGFDIFYGVSNNTWRFWDIEHARQRVGYNPQDNAEAFRGQS